MKRLTLAALFVMVLCGGAFAHNGALSLYADETITVCDAGLALFDTYNLNMYYVKDQGPDLGRAAEFRLLRSSSAALLQAPTWSPKINLTLGDLESGISITSNECIGPGETISYIGTIPVMSLGDPDTFTVRVVRHPATLPAPAIRITVCDPTNPLADVLGGTFIFNGDPNPANWLHCNPGVHSTSWGAIKSLYR